MRERPTKRAQRRVTAEIREFGAFPAEEDRMEGAFRGNARGFVERYGMVVPVLVGDARVGVWRVPLRVDGEKVVDLEVLEEDVVRAKSVYCDQCRVVGWSEHPVCGKRYHFIIRKSDGVNPTGGFFQKCVNCSTFLDDFNLRCTNCNMETIEDNFEEWACRHMEDSTHLLHGVVHGNGYGHLLRVNGKGGGSKVLRGCDIMSFWDRLCRALRVRMVSVIDISKKYGLEYRLLHTITTGRPWYGDWGYEFAAGSFALSAQDYRKAVDTLSNLPVSLLFSHSRMNRSRLHDVITFYLSFSDRKLETLRDLFCFLLQQIQDVCEKTLEKPDIQNKPCNVGCTVLCAWMEADVKAAEEAMMKVLRAVPRGQWISRRALKGASSYDVASLELLDYCLKGLGGKPCGDGLAVAVQMNVETNTFEYRLEVAFENKLNLRSLEEIPQEQLLCDLKFLYDALLYPNTMHIYRPCATRALAYDAARKLLDCKRFVKNYCSSPPLSSRSLHIWCELEILDKQKDYYTAPPAELVVLPQTATVAHLKLEATKAFQEVYIIFQKFQAERLPEYGNIRKTTHVKLLVGNSGVIKIGGRCVGDCSRLLEFQMERGTENWTVDCPCGAVDDDGERMLACDECGVWKHTRCVGVSDFDDVPKKFLCAMCYDEKHPADEEFVVPPSTSFPSRKQRRNATKKDVTCKNSRRKKIKLPSVAMDVGPEVSEITYVNSIHISKQSVGGATRGVHANPSKKTLLVRDNCTVADSGVSAIDFAGIQVMDDDSLDGITSTFTPHYGIKDDAMTSCTEEMTNTKHFERVDVTSSMVDITNRDHTERGTGRCKNDVPTSMPGVSRFAVTMTCK